MCDILKISDNELEFMTDTKDYEEGINILRRQYDIPLIFLTLGKAGSRAYYKELSVQEKPFLQENTIETTGAGDTFTGCALAHILEWGLDGLTQNRLQELLQFANAGASIITTRKGALKVMPEKAEIESFINSRKQ